MDVDSEELRDLLKKNLALAEENNRILRGMRRSARWGRFFSIVWWLAILALSAATYYYFLAPYIEQAQQIYSNFSQSGQQAQNYGAQLSEFLKQLQQR